MSGGFFRGTSADQDTRFSNKQAKLMKSQKFAPELENLVEMGKVKMDVMKPWIAHRVTELLGFEDEVLINFIYGLLEGKEVNGKEIQIQLTGFMEKNTGRFMKELWSLLLSAQNNASGVPQQFLDAKEEETRKKMAEAERITSEIQKRKEKEMEEREMNKMKMDVEKDLPRAKIDAAWDQGVKLEPSDSNARSEDDKDTNRRNGSRRRSRLSRSPRSAERSSSPPPRRRRSRSISNSMSNSRSRSNERRRSRSISKSPKKGSISPSPRNRPYYRRRSRSPSPLRRRFRSPIRRRSRSPIRRRSRPPIRYRSRTPIRRRSRSPASPARRRYRRSVSPVRRRPSGSSGRRRSPSPRRGGSRSPQEASSQSPPPRRTPPSPGGRSPKRQRRSPIQSPRDRIRTLEKGSPVRRAPLRDNTERRLPGVSSRSSKRDMKDQNSPRKRLPSLSPPPQRSPSLSESPPPKEQRRLASTHESPVKQTKERVSHDGSPSPPRKSRELKTIRESREASIEDEEHGPIRDEQQIFKSSEIRSGSRIQKDSPEFNDKNPSESITTRRDYVDSRKKDQDTKSEKLSLPEPATSTKITLSSEKSKESYIGEDDKVKLGNKFDQVDKSSDESDEHRPENNEKRKSRKSKRHELTSDDDYSDTNSQKDSKKQRKEEKRLKKEERRRRREERRRKKDERRSEKTKLRKTSGDSSEDDVEKKESEQKRLEIELREKALEHLRAKKVSGK